jgi:hypothetical protein
MGWREAFLPLFLPKDFSFENEWINRLIQLSNFEIRSSSFQEAPRQTFQRTLRVELLLSEAQP